LRAPHARLTWLITQQNSPERRLAAEPGENCETLK
jgi:hypothetical protein